jgi:hypothetical protein
VYQARQYLVLSRMGRKTVAGYRVSGPPVFVERSIWLARGRPIWSATLIIPVVCALVRFREGQ